MSVEASELASETWARWQGQVVNGAFPLGRFLGGSDRSGVFVTRSASHPVELAIKLVPTDRAQAESQLPRWKRAGSLAHPHLLRLLEWGGCQLEGLPYLYCVMEYADQTLAQLLLHRGLTEDEARELLPPTLEALAFLHARNLVQGQLKPANILVVGDQLKLASDTVRRVADSALTPDRPTVYDPPEARQGNSAAAGDIWALGVTLFEALTRSPPPRSSESGEIAFPAHFPAPFRELIGRCLSTSPQGRPGAAELLTWARGRSVGPIPTATVHPAAIQPAAGHPVALVPTEPTTARPPPRPAAPQSAPAQARAVPSREQGSKPRAWIAAIVAALLILALGWLGVRMLSGHHAGNPPAGSAPAESTTQAPAAAARNAAQTGMPVPAVPTAKGRGDAATAPAVHQVIPDAPRSATRTVRGHIKVWVRVIVDQQGTVLATVVDRSGPSRYFERLATEAARKWTFPPLETPARRQMQLRFDFSRDGTTAHVVALD